MNAFVSSAVRSVPGGRLRRIHPVFFLVPAVALLAAGCMTGSGGRAEKSAAVSHTLAQSDRSWDGVLLPAYPDLQPVVSILRIVVPPGVSLPWHRHPVINAGVLLSGELTVITDQGERLHLSAGDALVEVVGKWHYGRNDGAVPAEIIVFYAGAQGLPLSEHRDPVDP